MKFKSDIEVQAGLRDSSGSLGSSGQILSTTSGNVSWVTPTVNTVARDVQNQVKAGVAINKGQAVYVTGADGTNIIVGLASNTSEATSSKTLGLLNATVATNGFADVVQIGRLAGLNTIGANAGDPVWLGTNGNLIYGLTNKPYAPAHLVFLGIVTRVNANNGEIFVNVQNGFELKEIHDVDIITNVPINGDVLGYDGTLWVNKTIAEWLGYTPANASGTTNYVSKFTGTTSLGNSQIYDNGTNVGIGTSSPSYKLDVSGIGRFRDANTYEGAFIEGTNGVAYFGSLATDAISLYSSGVSRVYINSSGNVGIGTTSPQTILQLGEGSLSNATTNQYLRVNAGGYNALSYAHLDLFNFGNNFGNALGWRLTSATEGVGVSVGRSLSFNTVVTDGSGNPSSATERMRITSTGNVGIGTSSPSSLLTVSGVGVSGTSVVKILGSDSGTFNWGSSTLFGNLTSGKNVIHLFGLAESPNNSAYVGYKHSSDGSSSNMLTLGLYAADNLVNILANGNVGIGTSSPGHKLDVEGIINVNATPGSYGTLIRLRDTVISGTESFGGVHFTSSPGTDYTIGKWSTAAGAGLLQIRDQSGNAFMTINGGGNVGIGTSSPAYKLDVSSVSRFTGGFYLNEASAGTNAAIYLASDQTLELEAFGTSGSVAFSTGSSLSERMRITASGNVGIGTSSPSGKLNVLGSGTTAISISNSNAGTSGSPELTQLNFLGFLQENRARIEATDVASSANGSELRFYNANTSNVLTERMRIASNGAIRFNNYGSGTFTGTATQKLAVDSSGNIIEIPIGAGPVDGSGTTNYVTKWTDADTIGNSQIYDNGTNVGIGTTSPTLGKLVSKSSGYQFIAEPTDTTTYGYLGIGHFTNGTFIGTTAGTDTASDLLRFGTSGTERMRITSGGNVGIGTTSPAYKFEVSDGTRTAVINPNSSLDGVYIGVTEAKPLIFGTSDNERMRITSTGNVGIGTTSPGAKLVVYSGASVTDYASFATGDGSNTIQYIPYVGTGDYNNLSYGGGSLLFNNIGSRLTVGTHNGTAIQFGPTNTLISGNVGIGTTSPQRKLDIVGDHNTSTFRVYYPELNVAGQDASVDIWASEPGISFNGSGIGSNVNGQPYYGRTNPALGQGFIRFIDGTTAFHNSSTNAVYSERMRITPGGNVGIGTTSPVSKLHVYSSGEISRIESSSTTLYQTFKANGTDVGYLGNGTGVVSGGSATDFGIQSTNNFVFATGGSSERMRITSAGAVGIGTSYPTGKLDLVDYDRGMDGYGNFNIFTDDSAATSKGGSIAFGGNNSSGGTTPYPFAKIQGIKSSETGSYRGALRFATAAASSELIERMRIDHNGNVGIGTTSPNAKFQVVGNTAGSMIKASYDTFNDIRSTYVDWFGIKTTAGNTSNNMEITMEGGSSSTGSIIFSTGNSTATERMRINSSGFVGIGTTNPANRLDVAGSVYFSDANSYSYFQSSGFGAKTDYAGYNAGIVSNLSTLDSNYNVSLYASDNSNTYPAALTVQSDGGSSIGTTNRQQLSMEGLIQDETIPFDTTIPIKWIKVYNVDDNTHYFIPAYQ